VDGLTEASNERANRCSSIWQTQESPRSYTRTRRSSEESHGSSHHHGPARIDVNLTQALFLDTAPSLVPVSPD